MPERQRTTKSFKDEVGEKIEEAFKDVPGVTVERDAKISGSAAKQGHNRTASAADDRLRLLIERIERLEEEKKDIFDDIRDVYAEAKAVGYDAKIMRQVVRLRKMNADDRAEMVAILDTYASALGLQGVLPL